MLDPDLITKDEQEIYGSQNSLEQKEDRTEAQVTSCTKSQVKPFSPSSKNITSGRNSRKISSPKNAELASMDRQGGTESRNRQWSEEVSPN